MSHWRERPEGGNRFWLAVIRWITLHIGRGFASLALIPTTLYFCLVRSVERQASRRWLARVGAPRQGWLGVFIHIYTFAITIVDRVLLLAGREDELDIEVDGVDLLHDTLRGGQGCLLLGSHLGSFEAIRAYNRHAPAEFQKLKVVMDRDQNSLITQMLEDISPDIRNTVINARQPGPQIILQASEVLAEGGMVAMLADRIFRNETALAVPFIGQQARFPVAPLAFAAALEVPVFLVFGFYTGRGRYRLVFERLPATGPRPVSRQARREQLNQRVAAYAQRLEHYARRYPYNWFNFYDFWKPDPAADAGGQPDPGRNAG